MADVAIGIISALVFLAGLSVYSALKLAKRTDEITTVIERNEETEAALNVWLPESVFTKKPRKEAAAKKGN
ncbi:MAG: hypothetical protein NT018_13675 [Armatimonadetes bacterium]|nr:hypothetical protein [Armatimonadota bacterium]